MKTKAKMKMKTSTKPRSTVKTKVNEQLVSRLTQKTIIIVAVLAYLGQAVGVLRYLIQGLSDKFPFSLEMIVGYPMVVIGLPVVAFAVTYLMANKKLTKMWRAAQAAIVTILAMAVESFLSASNNMLFQDPLGYGDPGAATNRVAYLVVPILVTVVLVVAANIWLQLRTITTSDASRRLQKLFVVGLLVTTIGQAVVMHLGFTSGGATDLGAVDIEGIAIAAMELVVPAVVFGILYVLSARRRTVLQRSFIAMMYMAIGMLLVVTFTSVAFQWMALPDVPVNEMISLISGLAGVAAFVGVVIWHKLKKVI